MDLKKRGDPFMAMRRAAGSRREWVDCK